MRCKLVGAQYHTSVPLTPEDALELRREASNEHDPHARQVWAWLDSKWVHVGYVNRAGAAAMAGKEVTGARLKTAGNGSEIPMEVSVVV